MSETDLIAAKRIQKQLHSLRSSIAQTIRGKDEVIDTMLICLAAGGHLLIEDLPGLGKTTLAYCLARSIDCDFRRIQFTSDLLPGDVLGVSVYDEREKEFVFKKGPIFTSILLADEINRTTPKTQSALLEAMDRGKITVDGETYTMTRPFMVFATQNPVDYEGTFPLPESQMDRFLMRMRMGYPSFNSELQILRNGVLKYDQIEMHPVLKAEEVQAIQDRVPSIFVEDSLLDYILRLVTATRTESEFRAGLSTRGSLSLRLAAQAAALYEGRGFVIPEDIQRVFVPVASHRLGLRRHSADTLDERRIVEGILRDFLEKVQAPQ